MLISRKWVLNILIMDSELCFTFASGILQVTKLVSERSVFHLMLKVDLVWSVRQRITGEKWT